MQAAIDRVMQTYGMMVNLTPGQEAEAREKVSNFLKEKGGDEAQLSRRRPQIFAWPQYNAATTASSPQHRVQ
jgi:hypothetical protein